MYLEEIGETVKEYLEFLRQDEREEFTFNYTQIIIDDMRHDSEAKFKIDK